MMSTIKRGTGITDRSPERRSRKPDAISTEDHPSAETGGAQGSDLRLVIEPAGANGDYVYKLIDRATGQVVAERPRNQVEHLAEGPDYRAGSLVSTKA